ncbi:FHA domain-containing protein, partial [Streptomyces sp. NPDC001215]
WAVVDQNSTNGTTVNGGEEPIQPFVPVPLQDGASAGHALRMVLKRPAAHADRSHGWRRAAPV